MNVLRLVLVVLFLYSCSNSTDNDNSARGITFIKTYGGAFANAGESVIVTRDGDYVLAGWTQSTGNGQDDIWLLKIDERGDQIWDQTYGEGNVDVGRDVIELNSGDYLITGWTESFNADLSNQFLLRTDSAGTQKWLNLFSSTYTDHASAVIETSANSFVYAGFNEFSSGRDSEFTIVNVFNTGAALWSYSPRGPDLDDFASGVMETSDQHIVAVGTKGIDSVSTDVFVVKVRLTTPVTNDDIIFVNNYDLDLQDYAEAVVEANDGNYVIAGISTNFSTDRFFLMKINPNGDLIWHRTYPTGGLADLFDMKKTDDGGFIMTGFVLNTETLSTDAMLLKTDANGSEQWFETYGAVGDAIGKSVSVTPDGGYIVVGSIDFNNAGTPDLWLLKTDSRGRVAE